MKREASNDDATARPQLLKIAITVTAVTVLAMTFFYFLARNYVINRAEKNVENLLLSQKGIHEYVQQVMHPALYEYQKEGKIPADFYAPELFSSSFIVRNQHVFYNKERELLGIPPLYYKMAAINPRNPLNRADGMEEKLIKLFNRDRKLKSYRDIIELDGKKYLYVALPFLENSKKCLKCHGKRDDAPEQLQERYPGQGGFNEKIGDIRAIISIRAPLEKEYSTIFVIAASLLVGFLSIIGLFLFNNRLRKLVAVRTMSLEKEVDERKRAEEEIAASFERFSSVLDSIDALVYVADMDSYELLFVNKYGRDIWGDTASKLCWQTLQKGQEGPCPFCTNDRLLDADGKPTGVHVWEFQNTATGEWYECRDQAIRWNDGRLVRMEVAINISRRKNAEAALAAEKERLAVTLRSIGDGVITTDTGGRIVLMNAVAERLTGWSQEEAQGKPLGEVFHIINEKTRALCENPVEKVLASGQVIGLANHTALIARDGTERSIADSGAPIRDKDSRVIGVVLVFRDVTDKIKTEEELLKVKKLESVGVLAGGIAHDFNNILVAILGNINLALMDENLTDETQRLLVEAEKASARAKDLTQQLLTFSKGGEPVKETASIREIIRDSADFILHGSNVACQYEIPDGLWFVDIDKGQISQVVQNIILNAKQAMPLGGVITVRAENVDSIADTGILLSRKDKYVKISFSDNGIGIPENVLDKIFDPYFSTKREGSGLGLAITHAIISKHEGHISVQSQPGNGTVFTIYLPAATEEGTEEKCGDTAAPGARKARILLMDDEDMVRNVVKAMLSQLGHETVPAKDGAEAIRLYKESLNAGKPIDLAIMDLTVPGGMGGKEAVQMILAINPEAKVLVSSGYSNDPIMANCKNFGFCGAIVKPYQLLELKKAICQALA